jgi:mycothione reductase
MTTRHEYDLVIVGAGSGNMVPDDELSAWRIAVVESDRFGGTCLNRGCIPSKMLVHTANVAQTISDASTFGLHTTPPVADWPAIRDRIFGRIDPKHAKAVSYRREHGIDVFLGEARFVAPKVLHVGGEELTAERFVLAAGSRPVIPPLPGLEGVPYVTSDSVMRLPDLPASMIVIGGGYVAVEMSHVFAAFGTAVTIIEQTDSLLAQHDADIRELFTRLNSARFDVKLSAKVDNVSLARGGGIRVQCSTAAGPQSVEADVLLVATGRRSNSDRLGVEAGGLEIDDEGRVKIDDYYRTSVPGIWSFGDLSNHFGLKHMANAEVRVVRHNLLHPTDQQQLPFTLVPAAVFADPEVASVGATQGQLESEGRPYIVATVPYRDAAFGWALEDTTSFVKLLADPQSRLLLGAHIIGPQASILIQPLLQAMYLGNTVDQLSHEVLYIHPALAVMPAAGPQWNRGTPIARGAHSNRRSS